MPAEDEHVGGRRAHRVSASICRRAWVEGDVREVEGAPIRRVWLSLGAGGGGVDPAELMSGGSSGGVDPAELMSGGSMGGIDPAEAINGGSSGGVDLAEAISGGSLGGVDLAEAISWGISGGGFHGARGEASI